MIVEITKKRLMEFAKFWTQEAAADDLNKLTLSDAEYIQDLATHLGYRSNKDFGDKLETLRRAAITAVKS